MSGEFEIRRETILEATPQQAWDAINTGAGLASWLFPAGEGAPSGEGDVWGGHRVLVWDPPRHSHVRMDGEDGFFNSLENTIEDRGDGTLLLRYVHSGVIVDDWDTQYDGAAQHTDFYQHSLAEYLRHFAGRHAVYVGAEGPAASTRPGAFGQVRRALGIGEATAVGDRIHLEMPGLAAIDGVVDYLTPQFVGIRSDDALYRFYGRDAFGGQPAFAGHHLFAEGVDGGAQEQAWSAWLKDVFAER